MSGSRIDLLKEMLDKSPNDSFANYALGLEYMSLKELDKARDIFEGLRSSNPNYCATYYQLGKVYEMLGQDSVARKIYEQGIYVATQQDDMHIRSELEQAVNELLQ